ncbi:hypothetical protein PENFLA_c010G03947 [Penicillium flavigenum]|uniref:Uncharacterized protein n=1 Tax=Penicillium flavigenum TaxID=254877 RepID=A0A1V6TC66_9EURO|nr:hypothetical protein PENFLA_c010G03947 [Penicillium flavigenum]
MSPRPLNYQISFSRAIIIDEKIDVRLVGDIFTPNYYRKTSHTNDFEVYENPAIHQPTNPNNNCHHYPFTKSSQAS